MKIAYISPGAAGMYCGTCMQNNTLAAALIERGHQVALVPTYTPIRTDEESVAIDRVFFGAINVYLQQKSWLFRHTPRLVDWLLDRPRLLGFVSRFSASTDARELGELTVSMLEGEQGHQAKELDHLVEWLRDEYRPDVVHLSLSLFLGMARRIKHELGVPVVCTLQGEDLFIDDLTEPYRARVLELITERSADVDAFLVTSRYYAEHMSRAYGFPADKMRVSQLGIHVETFAPADPSTRPPGDGSVVVGYLARICPEKGFHFLVEAFRDLARELGPDKVRLRAAGYLGEKDRAYFDDQTRRLEKWGLAHRFDYAGEVDHDGKVRFLRELDVFSMPTVYREPKGLPVLEAMACGIPVVQPDHGSFPEILEATGGGILVAPRSVPALVEGLRSLIGDPERRQALGRAGRAAVVERYGAGPLADATLEIYRQALGEDR